MKSEEDRAHVRVAGIRQQGSHNLNTGAASYWLRSTLPHRLFRGRYALGLLGTGCIVPRR